MWKYILLIGLLIGTCARGMAQPGCTDSQATNFDPTATTNDGSCEYPSTFYQLTQLAELSDELKEASGLSYFDQQLWVANDASNTNEVFLIDSVNGTILRKVVVAGAENMDWEELAEDDTHLYVGDFGNNLGNRTDLRIYKIAKAALSNSIVNAEVIEFVFSDQTDLSINENNHNFDCEAFFCYQDSLFLFSKNWVNAKTRFYSLPNTPGAHIAQLRDSLDVDGLITGADINEQGDVLLLGYSGLTNFFWLLYDYQGTHFFSGNKRRIELGSVGNNGQTEGVSFAANGTGYICSERISFGGFQLPPKLLSFETRQWTTPIVDANNEIDKATFEVVLSPNPAKQQMRLEFSQALSEAMHVQVYTGLGRLVLKDQMAVGATTFEIELEERWQSPFLLLHLKDSRYQIVKKILVIED